MTYDDLKTLDDDELEQLLRAVVEQDDLPPPTLRTFALAAKDFGADRHLLDGGPVDSQPAVAGMRSGEAAQALHYRYSYGDTELYVTIETGLRDVSVSGALIPPVAQITRIAPNGEEFMIDCDEFGRFEFSFGDRFSLAFDTGDGRSVRTDLLG